MSERTLLYRGKTKDVYDNLDGSYTLQLKDEATGKDGVFDPGENAVGLSIAGLGRASLELSAYYFEKLKEAGIPTHYIDSDLEQAAMRVLPGEKFGQGLEFICRLRADGSFLRRYGAYSVFGADLSSFVEVTLKDDTRQDPQISKEALSLLGIMDFAAYEVCVDLTKRIAGLIAGDLAMRGLELFDIKFEFGIHDGDILLIDEIAGGGMGVYRGGAIVPPMELGRLVLGK